MMENEISSIVVAECLNIHKALGPGLFESVYEEILYRELTDKNIRVDRQKNIPVVWKNIVVDIGFRADLIIENKVIIELKSVEKLMPVHYKQLLTYLKIMDLRLGLLINFNENLIKDGIHRLVNNFYDFPQ